MVLFERKGLIKDSKVGLINLTFSELEIAVYVVNKLILRNLVKVSWKYKFGNRYYAKIKI